MPRQILIITLFISFFSCTNQEKVNEEKKDSVKEMQSSETLIEDSSKKKVEKNLSEISEAEKSDKSILEKKSGDKVNSKIRINTFRNTEISGYGYDIILDGKVYVHQPNIPALPGNNGFSTEEQARKVGELMIYKIENNVMPPTVDVHELDSLGIR